MEWKTDADGSLIVSPLSGWATMKVRTGDVLLAIDLVAEETDLATRKRQRVQIGMTASQAIEFGQAIVDAGARQFQPPNTGATN